MRRKKGSGSWFDANWIVEEVNKRGAKAVISQIPARRKPLESDQEMYIRRHLIENFLCKFKKFKRIAMRSDKNNNSCSVMIYIAAAIINGR